MNNPIMLTDYTGHSGFWEKVWLGLSIGVGAGIGFLIGGPIGFAIGIGIGYGIGKSTEKTGGKILEDGANFVYEEVIKPVVDGLNKQL